MKQLFYAFILLSFSHLVQAQSTVTITGTISHPKDGKVYIRYYTDYLSYTEATADSADLDKKGNFSMSFVWDRPFPATFYHDDEITEMYLSPGDNVRLTLDTKEFDESVKYEGIGSDINNYLAQKVLLFPATDGSDFKLAEKDFKHKTDSIHKKELEYFANYFSSIVDSRPSLNTFKTNEEAEIIYHWASTKTMYPMYYQYYNKLSAPLEVSPEYFDFKKDIQVFNPSAIQSSAYQGYLSDYVDDEIRKTIEKDTTQSYSNIKQKFIDENLKGVLKEFILAEWTYNTLADENDLTLGKELLDKLVGTFPKSNYVGLLKNTMAISSVLQPGNPAPDFTFPDLNGKMVSLHDMLGKVVYLDIWASWCGPCRGEIPFAKKLEEEMKDKDVVFLCVSVDEDEKAWKKIIQDKAMGGLHLISKGNFESQIAQLYNVKGIPRYVIIDKEGNLVSSNAARPSGNAKHDLEQLLN